MSTSTHNLYVPRNTLRDVFSLLQNKVTEDCVDITIVQQMQSMTHDKTKDKIVLVAEKSFDEILQNIHETGLLLEIRQDIDDPQGHVNDVPEIEVCIDNSVLTQLQLSARTGSLDIKLVGNNSLQRKGENVVYLFANLNDILTILQQRKKRKLILKVKADITEEDETNTGEFEEDETNTGKVEEDETKKGESFEPRVQKLALRIV